MEIIVRRDYYNFEQKQDENLKVIPAHKNVLFIRIVLIIVYLNILKILKDMRF